jgi:magnesium chelatase subunit D
MNPDATPPEAALQQTWSDALWALRALQVDGPGLGGAWIKARHGPVRDIWQQTCLNAAPRSLRVPISADDTALLGGIDLGATLQSGRMQWQTGLLAQADGAWVVLPMAERAPRGLLSRLTQAMDRQQVNDPRGQPCPSRFALLALDESDPGEGKLHPSVAQRLAFWIDIDALPLHLAQTESMLDPTQIEAARMALHDLRHDPEALRALMQVAESLGIDDVRGTRMAWRLGLPQHAIEHIGGQTGQTGCQQQFRRWQGFLRPLRVLRGLLFRRCLVRVMLRFRRAIGRRWLLLCRRRPARRPWHQDAPDRAGQVIFVH